MDRHAEKEVRKRISSPEIALVYSQIPQTEETLFFYVFRHSEVFFPAELTSLFFHFNHKICQPLLLHISFTFSIHRGTKSQTNCVCMCVCVCSWCLTLLGASISCKHHLLTTGSPASKHLTNKHTHKSVPACH